MTTKQSAIIDVGYPIYGAKFVNNRTILVTGGGGEGNNGIPNKITAIKCSFKVTDKNKRLQKFREIVLPKNEDSPMCLDIAKDSIEHNNNFSIFVGCNQSTQLLKSMNINNNLRKYVFTSEEHLRFVDAAQLEQGTSADSVGEYPKIVCLSPNNSVGGLMTSQSPSLIYIFNPDLLELNFKFKPEKSVEIIDFHLSPDDEGKTLCYITVSSIETISTVTGNSISSTSSNSPLSKALGRYNLSKVRFIDNSNIIVTASLKNGKGVSVFQYSIPDQKIVKQRDISSKIKGITAIDISIQQNLIALAGNDTSVTIIRLSDFKTVKSFLKLHSFAITKVAFSPSGGKLASVSAANTLHVMKIPAGYSSGKSIIGTLVHYVFLSILACLVAILLQKGYENGQLEQIYELSNYYAHVGLNLANDYGKASYEFVKEKVLGENVEGDDTTKKYFKMDDWEENDNENGNEALSSGDSPSKTSHVPIYDTETTSTASTTIDKMPDHVRIKEITRNIDELTKDPSLDTESLFKTSDNYVEDTTIIMNTAKYTDDSSDIESEIYATLSLPSTILETGITLEQSEIEFGQDTEMENISSIDISQSVETDVINNDDDLVVVNEEDDMVDDNDILNSPITDVTDIIDDETREDQAKLDLEKDNSEYDAPGTSIQEDSEEHGDEEYFDDLNHNSDTEASLHENDNNEVHDIEDDTISSEAEKQTVDNNSASDSSDDESKDEITSEDPEDDAGVENEESYEDISVSFDQFEKEDDTVEDSIPADTPDVGNMEDVEIEDDAEDNSVPGDFPEVEIRAQTEKVKDAVSTDNTNVEDEASEIEDITLSNPIIHARETKEVEDQTHVDDPDHDTIDKLTEVEDEVIDSVPVYSPVVDDNFGEQVVESDETRTPVPESTPVVEKSRKLTGDEQELEKKSNNVKSKSSGFEKVSVVSAQLTFTGSESVSYLPNQKLNKCTTCSSERISTLTKRNNPKSSSKASNLTRSRKSASSNIYSRSNDSLRTEGVKSSLTSPTKTTSTTRKSKIPLKESVQKSVPKVETAISSPVSSRSTKLSSKSAATQKPPASKSKYTLKKNQPKSKRRAPVSALRDEL